MSYLTSDEFLASIEKGFEATTDLKPVPVPDSLRYDPSDASLKRQASFGLAQGDMTLGSLGRVFSSAYDSLTKGGSFKLNSEINNMQRQLDIKAEYPEFKDLSPEDYTAAMTVGEISNYVFDPVLLAAYALVPGGMAARAAQFSAYEGAAEALRQVGRKGTVDDPVSVAVTASVAGVASLGLDKVLPYFKTSKESKELIEEVIEEAEDVVNSAPIITQADHVRNWWKKALDERPEATQSKLATLRKEAASGEEVSQADFVRAWHSASKGGTDKTVKVEPTLTKSEEQTVRKSAASFNKQNEKISFDDMDIQQRLISLSKVDLIINKLTQKLANPKTLKNPAIYEKRLENALRHKESLQKNITVDMMNTAEKKAASFADTIDDIAEKGELSNNMLSVLLAEATRPVVGATGGGVIGNMFDDDGDHNWTYYGMAAGVGVGFLSRRLNASPYLTKIQKETGDLIIGDAYKSLAGRTMAKLKIMTSSTVATKMDAAGGWTKAIGNKLFSRIGQGDANSVEFRVQRLHADFFEKLNSVVELPEVKKIIEQFGSLTEKNILKVTESNRTINTLAGEVMRGFIDVGSLKVGYKGIAGNLKPVTAEEIASIRKAVVGYQEQMNYVKKLVEDSGIRIKEDLGEDYGLPQLWDIDRASVEFVDFVEDLEVAIGIQVRNNGKKLNADNFAGSVTSKPAFRDNAAFRESQIFDVDPVSGLRTFRKSANYFENARQLTDQEAVKYLAQKGWLKLDAQEVLTEYGMQTIKVAEFAKTFGPNGELINLALNRIREAFKNQAKGLNPEAARKLSSERVNQENMVIDGVEAFWGRYGRPLQGEVGQSATTSIRTLQAMANMQYLSTVSIANLPDLLQPFINSNFGTAAKAAFAKPSERFSKLSNFKYDTTWEREMLNFTSGGMIETRGQAFLANTQDIFFKAVALKKVTQVARNFAYDVGVNRTYSLANKIKMGNKLTKSEVNELKSLGLDGDNLKALSKYKDINEAFDDVQGGRVLLDIAGRMSADRDAIIPLVGNRLLFTQHNNAAIRAMGQFLSWTMAKSAQLNKILSRVENGDARLAFKMVAVIPIYGALREFKGMVNPGTAKDSYEDEDYLDKTLKSLKISGQTSYWALDKIAEGLKYNVSSRDNFTGGIAPAIGYLEESVKTLARASGKDDLGEAAAEVGTIIPIVSQGIDIAENKLSLSKGGEVTYPNLVPNAPLEPDERIDKITGLPYNEQAGIAFIDEEDPLKRLGLVGGGSVTNVDPLERMGFGIGGAITKLVRSFTKSSKDDATGTFETVAAKELADATPYGSVDDVAESLTGKTVDDLDTMISEGSEEAKQVMRSQLGEARFREKFPDLKETTFIDNEGLTRNISITDKIAPSEGSMFVRQTPAETKFWREIETSEMEELLDFVPEASVVDGVFSMPPTQNNIQALSDYLFEMQSRMTAEGIKIPPRMSFLKSSKDNYVTQFDKGLDKDIAINMKEKDIATWQKANKLPESKRQKQNPEVIESLQEVLAGKKSIEKHNKLVDKEFPPIIYTKQNAPEFPTLVEVKGAVGKKTLTGGRGIIGADVSVDEGLRVSSRLDIPAYDQRGVWAVTLHEPGKSGKAFAYGQSAILKNVEFTTNPKDALDIAMGQAKGTIARMEGDWVRHNPTETYEKALDLLDSDEWVQVGMNPYKHSYFYDKATMKPLKSASEVIQVGPLVLAKRDKNLIYADADDFKIELSSESIKGKKKLKAQEINIDNVSFMEGGKVLKALSRGRLAGV